ncbi:MAG TPA: hypothetical protein VFJ43_17955, partial [Bacteroidia bacterium]|nr:hypothetical protein [Bacteroidia bacterium]
KEKGLVNDTIKQNGKITFYSDTFKECQVENGNVVDYSNQSTDSLVVPYGLSTGTKQILFLVNIPLNNKQNLYIYYSLNYNADGKVVGFGPAYLGQLVKCPGDTNIYQIEFYTSLKSKRKAPFILEKTKEKTDLKFIVEEHKTDSNIMINKIVQAAPNKIGGTSPLVFNVNKIMGHGALNFKIIQIK